jgi:hypothetical protein
MPDTFPDGLHLVAFGVAFWAVKNKKTSGTLNTRAVVVEEVEEV